MTNDPHDELIAALHGPECLSNPTKWRENETTPLSIQAMGGARDQPGNLVSAG